MKRWLLAIIALIATVASADPITTFSWNNGSDWPVGTTVELCANDLCVPGLTGTQHTMTVPVQTGGVISAKARAVAPAGYQCGDPLAPCPPSEWATVSQTWPTTPINPWSHKTEAQTMAIARRGSTNYYTQWENSSTSTITKESSVQVGDIILIASSSYSIEGTNVGGTVTITGFTKSAVTYETYGAFGATQGTLFYRIVDGTEGASFSISNSGSSCYGSAVLVAFSGSSLSIEATGSTDNSSGTAPSAPSLSAAGANTMLVNFYLYSDPATFTAPTGSDGSFSNSPQNTNGSSVSWDAIAESGETGTRTATLGTARDCLGFSVLLKESGGAAATGLPRRAIDGPLYGATQGSVR